VFNYNSLFYANPSRMHLLAGFCLHRGIDKIIVVVISFKVGATNQFYPWVETLGGWSPQI